MRSHSPLLGLADWKAGSGLRIGIVHARWNTKIIDALLHGTKTALAQAGVKDENIVVQSVPGSYELPYAVKQCVDLHDASHQDGEAAAVSHADGIIQDVHSITSTVVVNNRHRRRGRPSGLRVRPHDRAVDKHIVTDAPNTLRRHHRHRGAYQGRDDAL